MRRVTLDDLLQVAAALAEVPERDWPGAVERMCVEAHFADAVRKRLGARRAARFGSCHLGARVSGVGVFVSDRDAHRRLAAALAGLEAWRSRNV